MPITADCHLHSSYSGDSHTPMEEIDALFAQVEVYAAAREEAEFAAGCAELSRRMEAMANAHGAQWWNVL